MALLTTNTKRDFYTKFILMFFYINTMKIGRFIMIFKFVGFNIDYGLQKLIQVKCIYLYLV